MRRYESAAYVIMRCPVCVSDIREFCQNE